MLVATLKPFHDEIRENTCWIAQLLIVSQQICFKKSLLTSNLAFLSIFLCKNEFVQPLITIKNFFISMFILQHAPKHF